MNMRKHTVVALLAICSLGAQAQSLLYPKHFDLQEVTLLDGLMKSAMDKNIELLLDDVLAMSFRIYKVKK